MHAHMHQRTCTKNARRSSTHNTPKLETSHMWIDDRLRKSIFLWLYNVVMGSLWDGPQWPLPPACCSHPGLVPSHTGPARSLWSTAQATVRVCHVRDSVLTSLQLPSWEFSLPNSLSDHSLWGICHEHSYGEAHMARTWSLVNSHVSDFGSGSFSTS